jgi:outer membrane protein assembly factor BamB
MSRRYFQLAPAVLALLVVTTLDAQPRSTDGWPHWRGPATYGRGLRSVPLTWSDGENVRWKIEIPGRGHSTPIAWGDRLFLTTAVPTGARKEQPHRPTGADAAEGRAGAGAGEEHRLEVMAVDRATGKIAWQRTAATVTPHEGYHHLYGSFASNAPATDGERVYAFFGSHGVFAYDLEGKLLWHKDPGIRMNMRLAFGEGSGVVCTTGASTSSTIMRAPARSWPSTPLTARKSGARHATRTRAGPRRSWSSTHGVKQLVVTADTRVKAYDVASGKVVWEVAGLGTNPIPQPVQFRDTVLVMSGYREPRLMAVKLGRTGDLTGTDAVVWETTRGTSYTGSPALHDGRLYVFSDNGLLSVFDAATGEPHYLQARLPKPYATKSSPLVVGTASTWRPKRGRWWW